MSRTALAALALALAACGGDGDGAPLTINDAGRAPIGAFDVELDDDQLLVRRGSDVLFSTPLGQPFVVARAAEDDVESLRGSFTFRERGLFGCTRQTVSRFESSQDSVLIRGRLRGEGCRADYQLTFTARGQSTVEFDLEVEGDELNRVSLVGESNPDDKVYGFGTQYSNIDVNGKTVPVWVREQGIGRGIEPLTSLMNLTSPGSGGDWHTTYAPMPFYLTSSLQSLALSSVEYATFDFESDDRLVIEQWSTRMQGRIYAGESPLELIEAHTDLTGRMQPLPGWADGGAVVRVHGGSQAVRDAIAEYESAGVPLAAVWVEDWVGERDTFTGSRLWWNWEVDVDLYPDWADLVAEIRDQDIEVMIYFNPFLVDVSDKDNADRNLYAEALESGYLVADADGQPYLIGQGGFDAALVDFSNPDAVDWYQALMRDQLAIGVSGWMADFGEALPYDAQLFGGDGKSLHNTYPEAWAQLNRDAIAGSGRDDAVAFHRSGYTKSPGLVGLFWLGDQTVTWDEFDGIKTVVRGLVSSGISGMSLNHADIGGYLSVNAGNIDLRRTPELLQRWTELAAFTALFRTHETNRRGDNVQVYSDSDALAHFARFARVYVALADYRRELMNEARTTGAPLVRHTWLVVPDESETGSLDQQFMLGDDLVVAPVLEEGADTVEVYLPAGPWVRVGGETIDSSGEQITADAPLGDPAVFYRLGFAHASALETAWSLPSTGRP